jgi:hypothetical protein
LSLPKRVARHYDIEGIIGCAMLLDEGAHIAEVIGGQRTVVFEGEDAIIAGRSVELSHLFTIEVLVFLYFAMN